MVSLLKQHGATFQTGVRVASLAELGDPDVVMLDVAPAAAVRLAGSVMPRRVARALSRFRHGPGAFKVEFAVEGGIPWTHEPSRQAGTVHVGGGLSEIASSERLGHRGRMPDRPFVLVGQQYLADPSRSNGNVHPVYSYAHVPHEWPGDATARLEAQIERFAPGFRDRIVGRHVRSVAAMEAHDANWVGGDILTGTNSPRSLLFSPRLAVDPYSLGIPGVYLCSAATPPGAGAHGMCGFNAAGSALRDLERGRITAA